MGFSLLVDTVLARLLTRCQIDMTRAELAPKKHNPWHAVSVNHFEIDVHNFGAYTVARTRCPGASGRRSVRHGKGTLNDEASVQKNARKVDAANGSFFAPLH